MYGGHLHQRSLKTRDKQEALRREAVFRLELTSGDFGLRRADKTSLAQFETRFFEYVDQNVAAAKTRSYYRTHWKPLITSPLGQMNMARITPGHVHDWAVLRAEKVGASSVNGSLRTLRRALHLASEWHVIKTIPKIRLVKGERSREFVIDDALLEKMLAHPKCTPTLRVLLPFLIDTGLRLNEAMSLVWDDISDSVSVRRGKSKAARRTVPLTPRALKILGEAGRGDTRVFAQSSFTTSHQFKGLRDALKLPRDCVLHSCRHTFCTRLGTAGVSAFQIMQLAGHSSVAISQRYVHENQQALKDAIGKL